jgi:hypothetical protein
VRAEDLATGIVTDHSIGDERRGATRHKTLMSAAVVDPHQGMAGKCDVRNLSRTGAQLHCREDIVMPDVFWLRVDGEPSLRYCTVIWKLGRLMGTDFAAERAIRAADEEAKRIRKRMTLHRSARARSMPWQSEQ